MTRRLRIERLTWRGHGLALRPDEEGKGGAVVVPGTLPGEVVEVDGDQRLVRVLEPHPERVDPECDQAGRCPGCPLRHLSRQGQATLKARSHVRALRRIADVDLGPDWLPAAPRDGYRDRAVARPFRQDGDLRLGLVAQHGAPIDLARCPAQTERTRTLLAEAARDLDAAGLRPYDPEGEEGTLHHVVVHGADRVVVGVTDEESVARLDAVLTSRPEVALLAEVVSTNRPRILANPRRLRGEASATFSAGEDIFTATLPAWTPQTPSTLPALRAAVVDSLQPRPEDRILEIGCGVGTLSLPLARRVAHLTGVDQERAAIRDAWRNARAAGVENVAFRTGDGEKALRRLLAKRFRADLVLLHAMRRPFGEGLMRLLPALRARRILYLAPNAPSLARDLRALPGWAAVRLGFLDQMPGTAWLLSLCVLEPAGRSDTSGVVS